MLRFCLAGWLISLLGVIVLVAVDMEWERRLEAWFAATSPYAPLEPGAPPPRPYPFGEDAPIDPELASLNRIRSFVEPAMITCGLGLFGFPVLVMLVVAKRAVVTVVRLARPDTGGTLGEAYRACKADWEWPGGPVEAAFVAGETQCDREIVRTQSNENLMDDDVLDRDR